MKYKVITATLIAATAVHIGTGEGNELTDALIRRDGKGQPFIPGTAIAGTLRNRLVRLAPRLGNIPCRALKSKREERNKSCNCAVCNLFGDLNPSDEKDSMSNASRLLFFNAYLEKETSNQTMIRDGVGIGRTTGTAARRSGVKFDLEIIPAGTSFKLRIELRGVNKTEEQLLAVALSEWINGRLRLGGRVAQGSGLLKLEKMQFGAIPLDNAESLMSFLLRDKPWEIAETTKDWLDTQLKNAKPAVSANINTSKIISRSWLWFSGTLQAKGPLLSNDILSGCTSGFNHAPVLSQQNDWLNPILPGASLRGIIRFHAERIARTLTTMNAKSKADFLSCCPACDPNARVQDKADKLPLESCDSLLGKCSVQPDEPMDIGNSLCLACRLFGSTRLGSRLIVEDAAFKPANNQSGPIYKMLDFLAIDRFTGGGVDRAKFDALALWQPAFNLSIFLENPEPWELGWLQLIIRDFEEGWLSIGFGSAKGFGHVQLTDWSSTLGYLLPEDAPPGLMETDLPSKNNGIYTTKTINANTKGLLDMTQNWLDHFNGKILHFQREKSMELTTDNYFDDIRDIYCGKGDAS